MDIVLFGGVFYGEVLGRGGVGIYFVRKFEFEVIVLWVCWVELGVLVVLRFDWV